MSETLDLIITLSTQGFTATADAFSKIVAETIREHGDVYIIAKQKTTNIVRRLSAVMYSLKDVEKLEDLIQQAADLRQTVLVTFPQPDSAEMQVRPLQILLTLVALAKQYCEMIIFAKEMDKGTGEFAKMQTALLGMQESYDMVKYWATFYPLAEVMKQKENIITIGMLIEAARKEQQIRSETRIIKTEHL